jgi:hypothetical protein
VCGSSELISASAIIDLEALNGFDIEGNIDCVTNADLDLLRLVCASDLLDHLKVLPLELSKITSKHSANNLRRGCICKSKNREDSLIV